jgi:hypothetical protein
VSGITPPGSGTALPAGTCATHGYHGRVSCPRCSTSADQPPLLEAVVEEVLAEQDDSGVSPCFVHCGQAACRALGCVRVYNARHRDD